MLKITKMLAVVVAVSALAISAPSAMAGTYTWDGGGAGNDWFTNGNWDQPDTPTHLDDAVIDIAGTVDASSGLLITTTDPSLSWGWNGVQRGGKTVALSNGTVTSTGGVFLGYGGTATWTQTSGALNTDADVLLGGYDYDIGVAGSGTFNLSGTGTVQAGRIYFAGGTQLFNQTGGTVTAASIGNGPPWHQPVFGSYDMNGGTLTLTSDTNPIQEPGGEAGTAWRFNFTAGDIYLGGDQRGIGATFYFNVLGDPQLYTETYHAGTDVTHLYYIPEPATMALLAFGGLGVLLRRKRR